jgi:aspartate carbamoyltransferase regulatory subunit
MTTSIKLKKSSISGRVPNPGDLDYGELAINYADGILYFKNSTNVVGSISGNSIGVDSAATIAIIDSAYVQSRQINNPSGVDSSATINLIDSAYIQARQIDTNTQRDSAFIRGVFSAGGDITYNSSTGQFSLDVESVYTADNFDSDYILAKDSANTAVERNKHDATTKNFAVTVASKTADHVYNGTGSGSAYVIDGVQSPIIQLQIGRTYRFTLSSSSMSNHPFRFYYDAGRNTQYNTNVTTTSTYAEIEITESTPTVLHYQCSAHGYMGHAFVIGTRNLTGFNTDNLSEGSSNVYYSNTRVETLVDSSYVQSRQINNPSGVDSSATVDLIDSAYVQARQINNPSGVDSAATVDLIDSAYVQARQINNPSGVDSSATIALVDSSYVQSRQIKYTNDDFADSAFVTSQINSLIDAAPGALNTLNELAAAIGDDANFSTTVTNSIATKLTSAQTSALIDSAYVQARQINNPSGVDSSATINLIDSSYVQARQTPLPPAGVDSAATIALVDSAYVQSRQINNPSGVDSAATIALVDSAYIQARQTLPDGVDSAATISLVDSAYVQARFGTLRESNNSLIVSGSIIPETDSAFSLGTAEKKFKDLHLSGGTVFLDNLALSADPVTQTINIGQLDSNNIVNVVGVIATVDSAGVSAIVDSAFLEARLGDFVSETELTSKNFTTFDSNDATSVIDSSYINSLNANAGALNGQNGAHYLDYNNFTNTPQGGVDYGNVIQSATSAIDILDILIAQTTVDYGTLSSPGSLKSNYGTL